MFAQIPGLLQRAAQHLQRGELPEAVLLLQQVLDAHPRQFDALHMLGVIRAMRGERAEALELFRKALSVNKSNNFLHFNLAKVLSESGQEQEALPHHRKATQLAPDHAEAWLNFGKSLLSLGRYEDALTAFNKATTTQPNYAEAYNNKGLVLADLGRIELAISAFDHAIQLRPDMVDAHWNRALQCLKLGDYAAGWPEFELRWQMDARTTPQLATDKPRWTGQAAAQPLLLWGEQGIGDQILYSSILPDLANLPQKKYVALDKRLIPLYQRSMPQFEFLDLTRAAEAPDYAEHLPLGSLPPLFRPSQASFETARHPYLVADAQRVAVLRQKASRPDRLVCGVSWSSNRKGIGSHKSISLAQMLPPLASDRLHFVNLQYGDTSAERDALRAAHGIEVQNIAEVDNFNDIDGLAALIDACDVVLTTSNSTAHLAGALGKTTLLLLPFGKGRLWYWTEIQGKNPWYPSVKAYPQVEAGQWRHPLSQLARDLSDMPCH